MVLEGLYNILGTNQYFGNTLGQYVLFFAAMALAVILGRALYWVFENIVKTFTEKSKTKIDDIIFNAIRKPIILVLVIIGFYAGSKFLTLTSGGAAFFANVTEFLVILNIGWFIIAFIDALIIYYVVPFTDKTNTDLDDHLIPVVRTSLKVVIFAVTLIVAFSNIGYDVGAFLAGLGIGGLAFALAAKDLLANLFGGITILADRPFKMGDIVEINGKKGTVAEIGMRTSKIKTFDNTFVIVPNSNITTDMVENISAGGERRYKVNLGLVYNTSPVKIEKAIEIAKKIVSKQEGVNADRTICFFESYGDFSLNVLLIYYIEDTSRIVDIRNTIHLEILKQFNKAKIEFAFPTQTIELKKK